MKMGILNTPIRVINHRGVLMGALFLSIGFIFFAAQVINAAEATAVLQANKTADKPSIVPAINNTIEYTIVITNSGEAIADNVVMTDSLAAELAYIPDSLAASAGTAVADNSEITWHGTITNNSSVTITYQAAVTSTVSAGDTLTSTSEITGTGTLLTPFTTTGIVSPTLVYMPVTFKAPPKPTLVVTRPNSANQWTATWSDGGPYITSYELQESHDPDFGTLTNTNPGDVGLATTQDFAHSISSNSVYYYRVRAIAGSLAGGWSDVVEVAGGYRDDFNDPSTGWGMRRTTYLEETNAYYGSGNEAGQLVVVVGDRWDWIIASPLVPAPDVPYSIEYQAKVHDASNLVSGGMVFGGDWNFEACPEIGNVYRTDNCFNHFYNFNYIFYGPIKLLHERVDRLEWCLNCNGSPLKRLGPTQELDPAIGHNGSLNWHTYRVDVKADGAYLYIDGVFKRHFTDTTFINDPYFGVFASTDEYKPSIWLYEYYQVTPLD